MKAKVKFAKVALRAIKKLWGILSRINSESNLMRFRCDVVQLCKVCSSVTSPFQIAYGKFWYRCPNCDYLQSEVKKVLLKSLEKGEGFRAGTGVGGGGYREYWIANLLRKELGTSRVLLYGTGNTPTFKKLYDEGVDVWGCDLSIDLVSARRKNYGERFFHVDKFPDLQFDAIVAVEVFEHLLAPVRTLEVLSRHLNPEGVIAGTTDFYEGGDISSHIYLKSSLHIAYWSKKSFGMAAYSIERFVSLFKLECPGSVYPDEKFGLLWPRKRVFFMFPDRNRNYFRELAERYPILPINKP